MAIDAPPLVIPLGAWYPPSQIEQNHLQLQEAIKVDLEEEEKKIRGAADAALASLGAMVRILFVTTLAATAVSALHNKKTPVLVTTLTAVLSMMAFSVGISQGIIVCHQNLQQLKWPIKVLSLKKSEFNREVRNLKLQFLNRGIYIDAADFRKLTSRESLLGEDLILNEGYGLKFRCLLSYAHQSYNLTKPYKGLMICYSVISFVVLLGNVIAAILVLTGNKTLGI